MKFLIYRGIGHGFIYRGRACHHAPSDEAAFRTALGLLGRL